MAAIADIIELVKIQLSTSSDLLTDDGLTAAVNTATSELRWVLPQTDTTKILWITKRALRHACFILWVASAQKFKYKQVNLNQRFDHYDVLLKAMDLEYEVALNTQTNIFSDVDVTKMFGSVIGSGFVYDSIGNDLTYDNLTLYINSGV
jgi:hypothetical protein